MYAVYIVRDYVIIALICCIKLYFFAEINVLLAQKSEDNLVLEKLDSTAEQNSLLQSYPHTLGYPFKDGLHYSVVQHHPSDFSALLAVLALPASYKKTFYGLSAVLRVPWIRNMFLSSAVGGLLLHYYVHRFYDDGALTSSVLHHATDSGIEPKSDHVHSNVESSVDEMGMHNQQHSKSPLLWSPLLTEDIEHMSNIQEFLEQGHKDKEIWQKQMKAVLSVHASYQDSDFYEILGRSTMQYFMQFLDPSQSFFTEEDREYFMQKFASRWLYEMVEHGNFDSLNSISKFYVIRKRESANYLHALIGLRNWDQLAHGDEYWSSIGNIGSLPLNNAHRSREQSLKSMLRLEAIVRDKIADFLQFPSLLNLSVEKTDLKSNTDQIPIPVFLEMLKDAIAASFAPYTQFTVLNLKKMYTHLRGTELSYYSVKGDQDSSIESLHIKNYDGWFYVTSTVGAQSLQKLVRPGDIIVGMFVQDKEDKDYGAYSSMLLPAGYKDLIVFQHNLLQVSSISQLDASLVLLRSKKNMQKYDHDIVLVSLKDAYEDTVKPIVSVSSIEDGDTSPIYVSSDGSSVIVKIPSFSYGKGSFLEFMTVYSELFSAIEQKNISSLVIDLRGNTGGFAHVAQKLLTHLGIPWNRMNPYEFALNIESYTHSFASHMARVPFFKSSLSVMSTYALLAESFYAELLFQSKADLYDGPIVVLVDSASASAAEYFAQQVMLSGRGVVVGSQSTAGKFTAHFAECYTVSDQGKVRKSQASKISASHCFSLPSLHFYSGAKDVTIHSDIIIPSIQQGLEYKYLSQGAIKSVFHERLLQQNPHVEYIENGGIKIHNNDIHKNILLRTLFGENIDSSLYDIYKSAVRIQIARDLSFTEKDFKRKSRNLPYSVQHFLSYLQSQHDSQDDVLSVIEDERMSFRLQDYLRELQDYAKRILASEPIVKDIEHFSKNHGLSLIDQITLDPDYYAVIDSHFDIPDYSSLHNEDFSLEFAKRIALYYASILERER